MAQVAYAPLKDRVPPHNEEAEVAVLGAMLLDGEAASIVLRYLRQEDFYRETHKKIFQATINLTDRGQTADIITIADELRAQGWLQSVGGAVYVSSLTSGVPTSANVEYYARIVRDCSIRRTLTRIASEIIARSFDESISSRLAIEEAERQIKKIL